MTRIVDGYAQPDVVAEKDGKKVVVFVETPESLRKNIAALVRSWLRIKENEPDTRVDLVHTVPRGQNVDE